MVYEPMEEDDSFNDPVPRSVPLNRQKLVAPPPKDDESDVESDDSFERFEPTQTTGGGSAKSSASSTQSTEAKAPPPTVHPPPAYRPQQQQQQNIAPPTLYHSSSKQYPPTLQRSSCTTHGPSTGPPPPSTQKGPPFRPIIPQSTQKFNGVQGIHSAVTNTKNGDVMMTQKPTTTTTAVASSSSSSSSSQIAAPASPNSLSRHRSANSGLRNAPFHTPNGHHRPGNMFGPPVRTTPPSSFDSQSSRPVTPSSGDVIMLRDQLDVEKRRIQKLQVDYHKDAQKKEEEHQKHLTERNCIIERQKREIEMLKSTMACQKSTVPPMGPTPPPSSSSATVTQEIKKVYPKIPMTSEKKTPRRPGASFGGGGHISAFRHPFKEELDDTFEMNASCFEPSATSTPKLSGLVRTGIRRPLDLGEDGDDANYRGAPTPKRPPVFKTERRREKRTKDEIQNLIRNIQMRIDPDSEVFEKKSGNFQPKIESETAENGDFIDKSLCRKMRILKIRKNKLPAEKSEKERNRHRKQLLKGAELRPAHPKTCSNCIIDSIGIQIAAESEKEWRMMETQRCRKMIKDADEHRIQHYTTTMHAIQKKGIDEIMGMEKRNEEAEQQFERKIQGITPRPLEEIREASRAGWTKQIMEKLDENGELTTNLDIKEDENEDFIWSDDEFQFDWQFPKPYNHPYSTLCSDCRFHQKRQRRMARKEFEKEWIRTKCLQKYGIEKRDDIRNMSILTKSRIEAADLSLFRENDVIRGDWNMEEERDGDADGEKDDEDDANYEDEGADDGFF